MSRINRIARALVAVRPFPLTDEMKRIIEICSKELRSRIRDGRLRPKNVLYDGRIQLRGESVQLVVGFTIEPTGISGRSGSNKEGTIFAIKVNLDVPYSIYDPSLLAYLENKDQKFWVWFRGVLLHELIHIFDIKKSDPLLKETVGKNPLSQLNQQDLIQGLPPSMAESYHRSPTEKSAFQGQEYYEFKKYAEEGRGMNEAIRMFFAKERSDLDYTTMVKGFGAKEWKDYQTRIYKSAEQAYKDVEKEQQ